MTDEELLIQHLGREKYFDMLDVLSTAPNGLCACTTGLLFPRLLEHYGVQADKTYIRELGLPDLDGGQAATLKQFDVIWRALGDNGFI